MNSRRRVSLSGGDIDKLVITQTRYHCEPDAAAGLSLAKEIEPE